SRPSEEIHMMVLAVDARLLLRAVADAEVHALMVAFGDRDARRHLRRLLLLIERFDGRKLKERHAVQAALRLLHEAALVQVARLERQLAPDHAIADALVA